MFRRQLKRIYQILRMGKIGIVISNRYTAFPIPTEDLIMIQLVTYNFTSFGGDVIFDIMERAMSKNDFYCVTIPLPCDVSNHIFWKGPPYFDTIQVKCL